MKSIDEIVKSAYKEKSGECVSKVNKKVNVGEFSGDEGQVLEEAFISIGKGFTNTAVKILTEKGTSRTVDLFYGIVSTT